MLELQVAVGCADAHDQPASFVEYCAGLGRRFHAREARLEARLRIDQELAGQHNLVARLEALADFSGPAHLDTDLDVLLAELPVALGQHHEAALPRADHGFARDQHGLRGPPARQHERREHARLQLCARIGHLDARAQGPRHRIHVGQDRAHTAGEHFTRVCGDARLNPAARHQPGRLRLRHFGADPDAREIDDAEQRRPRHDRHAFAHVEFGDHAGNGRTQREAREHLAVALDLGNVLRTHAEQRQALAGSVGERLRLWRGLPAQQQVLLLRARPFGKEDLHQRRALGHRIERRTRMELLHKARAARLNQHNAALIPAYGADRLELRLQRARLRFRRADAEVLHDLRIDRHLALRAVTALVCVLGHQLHVHERRLAGLVEPLLRHHGVVPVKDLALARWGCGSWRRRSGRPLVQGVAVSRKPGARAHRNNDCNDDRRFHDFPSAGSR